MLVGGLRVLTAGQPEHGVLTNEPGTLTNDFFVNLLDMGTKWQAVGGATACSKGATARPGEVKWTGTRVDLIFGSHSQLRALAEVYASRGREGEVREDFVAAWTKVMNADRFDLAPQTLQAAE